jgi:hypothetical protein
MQIAICGSAPSSRLLAPFKDLSWEIWACSPQNYDYSRVDAWFEVHSLDRKHVPENKPYFDKLEKHPRVYVTKADGRLPNAIVLEVDRLVNKYPYFLTSSLAWMMACAIEAKPERIGIWGVDMSANDEYAYQRPGMHYFIEKANEANIEIVLPPQSDLAMPIPVYGLKEHWPMYWKLNAFKDELEGRIAVLQKKMANAEKEALVLKGANDYREYIANTWLVDTRPITETPDETV